MLSTYDSVVGVLHSLQMNVRFAVSMRVMKGGRGDTDTPATDLASHSPGFGPREALCLDRTGGDSWAY